MIEAFTPDRSDDAFRVRVLPRWINLELPDRPQQKVAYHVLILAEAGLLEAQEISSMSSFDCKAKRLTWQGHEFLDAARNNTLWERAKAETLKHTGGLSLELLQALLLRLGKEALGITD